MAVQAPPGPLSGPSQPRNRRRNPFWRFRRILFVLAVVATVAIGAGWSFVSQVELIEDDFESLIETTYICTGEVLRDCGPGNAANELALEGEDRVVVDYEDIPQVLIDAVVATEDKTFFSHRGVDPGGLMRAAYQVAKQQLTSDGGSFQGGSTITQQYVKLVTEDDADQYTRKGREIVRAIKLEQELSESLGSTEAAKQQIITRYLNRANFGRGAYGVQAAARAYFDTDVQNLTLPESAYLAGLLRSPNTADASEDLVEAERRRTVSLVLMAEQELITPEEQAAAEADTWPRLIPNQRNAVGLGDVKGSEYGTEYFISAVRTQLNEIYPNGEYFTQSLRVYTTLDPDLQRLAYRTITGRLNPSNPFMPNGSLVALDDNGEVLAMMGGASWEASQVNLATGRAGGGSGFQAGSQMKTFAVAEYIEQGFSPESLYEAPFTWKPPRISDNCDNPEVKGGVSNNPTRSTHRTVYQALASSLNTVFLQLSIDIGGGPQLADMARKLGIESEMRECPGLVLGDNSVSPLEMANAYATLAREGVRVDPVMIERIEDADGNVLCWYPQGSCDLSTSRTRQGEEAISPAVARQVNGALVGVVTGGSGRATRLIDEETETTRPSAGKTGTSSQNRDAWFTGFTCGMTTSVWMGYPGIAGETPRHMNDVANLENGLEDFPTMEALFGTDEYNNSRGEGEIFGSDIPAEMWHDFMIVAAEDLPLCEDLPTEGPGQNQRIVGQELLTTLLHCTEPDPQWLATLVTNPETGDTLAPGETLPETTLPPEGENPDGENPDGENPDGGENPDNTQPDENQGGDQGGEQPDPDNGEGGGDGGDEDALGPVVGVAYRRPMLQQQQGEEQQQQPPQTAPPTTEECIDVDLDGNPLETTIPLAESPPANGGGNDG
ncbi:MAG: transglycosylase domain-containing protein [Actinomycetota bacterium]